jgi:hypothetical protein
MGILKESEAASSDNSNVIPFQLIKGAANEPQFSNDERAEIRKMLRQFANIRAHCPTARRESGD